MNGPPEESADINYFAEVHDQVQAKKRNEERNKRDATVLEKLKASSVEDIILDESKTQILSIAGVEYASLSAKVRLYYCREMGIVVPNKKRKKEEITELILNHVSGQVLKELVKQPMKKKAKVSKTCPAALTKDGTLYRIIKEERERLKLERDQLAVFLQLKNDVFEKNQLYKTAKKELDDDPDDEDKHEVEKHFRTTVNFLCQKYEKMKKQVGYESE